ncbi:uncharacterized protein MYCFIDRAFT_175061 [Pseudocercospora fijiensis CIRAD86]|uniref:Uncharacterized protein n=1 Tax=Pseudocercospora fijiensis (strain CIRAD86) TaxID=383855 RepID=M2ZXB8_PSEFD|nr:uncharacterized protein MYCFIDRAFT_175061 [Pseudocercospora fijiensis CIRAD86]EME83634.1 hypothetical protein MYCFIDRAFT_175061 [Pseudocercospora fijiensis CIRAD86]
MVDRAREPRDIVAVCNAAICLRPHLGPHRDQKLFHVRPRSHPTPVTTTTTPTTTTVISSNDIGPTMGLR